MQLFNKLLSGAGADLSRLMLGEFEFQGLEMPESITIGAKQQTVIHKLVGGGRIVDSQGLEYDNLSWSGWFVGQQAVTRSKQLETLRDAGRPLVFSLDQYALTVLIDSLSMRFEHASRRAYSIDLLVLGPAPLLASGPGLTEPDDLILNDLISMQGLSQKLNDSGVSAIINDLRQTVDKAKSEAGHIIGRAQEVLQKLETAQGALAKLASRGEALKSYTSLGGMLPGNPVDTAVNQLLSQVHDAARYPVIHQMQSVLGRLQKNLSAGPVASGVQTVATGNTSLQKLAADAYGDQSRWPAIAVANGLDDPQVVGIRQLRIPREA